MAVAQESTANVSDVATFWVRVFSWCMLAVLAVFLVNNYLVTTQDWPGTATIFHQGNAGTLAWIQLVAYFAGFAAAVVYVLSSRAQTLRADSALISDANIFLIRAFFWAVLLIGLVDMVVSFLRVEGLLIGVVGEHSIDFPVQEAGHVFDLVDREDVDREPGAVGLRDQLRRGDAPPRIHRLGAKRGRAFHPTF